MLSIRSNLYQFLVVQKENSSPCIAEYLPENLLFQPYSYFFFLDVATPVK